MNEQSATTLQMLILILVLTLFMIFDPFPDLSGSSKSPKTTASVLTLGESLGSPQLCLTLSSYITVLVDESIYTNCPWSRQSSGVICWCSHGKISTER